MRKGRDHRAYRRLPRFEWPVEETTGRNANYLCHEVAWAGIGSGILISFLSIFALRLGATPFEVGLLTTGPAIAGIIFPLPAARLVRRRWGKRVVVLPLALARLLFAALVCIPWVPAPARVPALVAAVGLLAIPSAYFTTAFTPLLAKVLPTEIRARVLGVRGTLAGLTSTLAVLGAGKVLDVIPYPINFQVLFVIGFVTTQTSTYLVGRVHLPLLNEQQPTVVPAPNEHHDLPVPVPPETALYWRHTGSAVILFLGIYIPAALYPVVLVDKLHATDGWIGALATMGGLASVILSPVWARAAMRLGNRLVLVVCGVAYTLIPILATLAPNVFAYIPVSVGSAGLMAGLNLTLFQCLLEVAPVSHQTHYTATYSMIVNGAVAGGPLLGTFLLGTAGMPATFGLAAACSLVGALLLSAVDPTLRIVPGILGGRRAPANGTPVTGTQGSFKGR